MDAGDAISPVIIPEPKLLMNFSFQSQNIFVADKRDPLCAFQM